MDYTLNGQKRTYTGDADRPLLWVLREDEGLTGTKYGCGIAACGACTVLIDGSATRACMTPMSAVENVKVTTVEGVSGKAGEAVRQAWREMDVVQCGWCQSGQMLTATAFLSQKAAPSAGEIVEAMDNNLCRCATYHRVTAAVARAADIMKG
ncbi:MAG: (2Fe-2S)-binding protein [Micropepsaceae bacterium]